MRACVRACVHNLVSVFLCTTGPVMMLPRHCCHRKRHERHRRRHMGDFAAVCLFVCVELELELELENRGGAKTKGGGGNQGVKLGESGRA